MKQILVPWVLLFFLWVISTAVIVVELSGGGGLHDLGDLRQYLYEEESKEGWGPGFVPK